jgi:hypothetical protein
LSAPRLEIRGEGLQSPLRNNKETPHAQFATAWPSTTFFIREIFKVTADPSVISFAEDCPTGPTRCEIAAAAAKC